MTPKAFVTTIASILVLCSATVILIYISKVGFGKIVPQSVRFTLTCALSVSLVRGWNPGRWIVVVLTGLGGIGSIIGGVNLISEGQAGLWLLSLGGIFSCCVIGLLTPFAGRHFQKNRRS